MLMNGREEPKVNAIAPIPEESRALREFEKVPGKWRCLSCSALIDGGDFPPACHCGSTKVVPLSWKLYGNKGWRRAEQAEARTRSLEEDLQKTNSACDDAVLQKEKALAQMLRWRGIALIASASASMLFLVSFAAFLAR